MDNIANPRIRHADRENAEEALHLLFERLSEEDRREHVRAALEAVGADARHLEWLLEARRDGQLVGAVFAQLQPGRTANLHMPGLTDREPTGTAEALLNACCSELCAVDVRMAQVVLDTVSRRDDSLLRGAGFRWLAELLYLVAVEDDFPRREPQSPLAFQPHDPAHPDRIARLVDETYRGTLDCPDLNGLRSMEDVLAGYRAAGVFDPSRWLIVRHGGRDVGCLLLADHPEHSNWELVYMGLVASVRGRGWGRHVARRAQWLCKHAGRHRLVVAVDSANWPATGMYESVGFTRWDSRQVYVKHFAR